MNPALDFVDVILYSIFGVAGLGAAVVGILALTGYGSRWTIEFVSVRKDAPRTEQ